MTKAANDLDRLRIGLQPNLSNRSSGWALFVLYEDLLDNNNLFPGASGTSKCSRNALNIRDLTQQDGCKTQDGRMTKQMSRKSWNVRTVSRHIFSSFCRPECSSRPVA